MQVLCWVLRGLCGVIAEGLCRLLQEAIGGQRGSVGRGALHEEGGGSSFYHLRLECWWEAVRMSMPSRPSRDSSHHEAPHAATMGMSTRRFPPMSAHPSRGPCPTGRFTCGPGGRAQLSPPRRARAGTLLTRIAPHSGVHIRFLEGGFNVAPCAICWPSWFPGRPPGAVWGCLRRPGPWRSGRPDSARARVEGASPRWGRTAKIGCVDP